ncbi:hypothetical protein PV10_07554 [Exophiala mesophila]|uniref:Methyltransferase type 11 domain-containing protein n=1 Tax=Exophiala mesophila TaxID=212818 RepID=A0A0D1WMH5_EXOME|nr:uncharacterized protein PV10_07554 [Exophiala mesophila]KIV90225.1 hypothetical protein PV10_07554 [Exophiala mesophila]
MSHRPKPNDTRQGISRTKDATVPRAGRLQSSREDDRQLDYGRPTASSASRSQPPRFNTSRTVDRNLHTKQATGKSSIHTSPDPRTLESSRKPPLPSVSHRSAAPSVSSSQEVPLLIDTGLIPRTRMGEMRPEATLLPTRYAKSQLPSKAGTETAFGLSVSSSNLTTRTTDLPPRLIPELQALAASSSRQQDMYSKSASSISSPSTRFSNTPSPWSVSTTTTTPTSWSSASPGIVQHVPLKPQSQRSQTVPVPTVRREKTPKLPAVVEAFPPVQSHPSASTESVTREKLRKSPSTKRTPLNTPAPTPPPRTSSAKQALSRTSSRSDKQRRKLEQDPTESLTELDRSPLARHADPGLQNVGDSLQRSIIAKAHDDLQQSLVRAPTRPSRHGVTGLDDSRPVLVNTHRSGFTSRHQQLLESGDETSSNSFDASLRGPSSTSLPRPPSPQEPVSGSPSRLGKLSRLGLFSRRGKSPANEVERSPRKLQRKGPVAGTGHEGYGKYGKRGRKQSQESSSVNNSESERSVSSTRRIPIPTSGRRDSRGSSRQNRSSQSDLDEFAATRLKPTPIRGGSGSSMGSPVPDQGKYFDHEAPVPLIDHDKWGTPSQSQNSIASSNARQEASPSPKVTSGDDVHPTLAVRRSQRFLSDREPFSLPTPIRTEDLSAPLYLNSHETGESLPMAPSTSTASTTAETNKADTLQAKKHRKLRWNIFRKKEVAGPDSQKSILISSPTPEEMSVSVSAVPVSRPMPYYAMLDSESEINANTYVDQHLLHTVQSPAVSPFFQSENERFFESPQRPEEDDVFLPNISVPPLQSFASSPPPVPLQSPSERIHVQLSEQPRKQPRLARVGRIPPVVPRNERQHKPSRASFSQPFVRQQGPQHADLTLQGSFDGLENSLESEHRQLHDRNWPKDPGIAAQDHPPRAENEFLQLDPRHASDFSSSSTSEGTLSHFGPALAATLGGSSSLHSPQWPDTLYDLGNPSVDEVWNEYDDFIDQVMSPSQERRQKQAVGLRQRDNIKGNLEARRNLHVDTTRSRVTAKTDLESTARKPALGVKRPVFAPTIVTSATPPVVFSSSALSGRNVGEDIRLRRSRIVSALHSSMDPSSPFSIRDLLREYETPLRDSGRYSERLSTSTAGQSLERVTTTATAPEGPGDQSHQETSTLVDVVERSKDPARQSELHYAFLMVAKWLSFGRVLFSPAHDEIQTIAERHVLVIDGLGNGDWSIYCAVTYEPHKAFVHNLRERPTTKHARDLGQSSNSPNNHRRAEVSNFYERFPFPPSFFSAVVLRFPPAMAEAKMKNIISECRRVLLPGGYLELMLLDLDIVNMGVQTRRAIRDLKFKMTTADEQISLRPIIDNVQGVLGARGFSNISRCIVGVPVAGRPSGSEDSSSSRSSGGSDGLTKPGDSKSATASPRMTFSDSYGRKGAHLSLNDLIADHSDNADAKIGKIVSSTARRWWQHCFEATVIADGNLNKSVFADKGVLGECKARGSSFKMLIAYAQRPVFETRRRTMSEPVVPTLATAGNQRQTKASPGGARRAT